MEHFSRQEQPSGTLTILQNYTTSKQPEDISKNLSILHGVAFETEDENTKEESKLFQIDILA